MATKIGAVMSLKSHLKAVHHQDEKNIIESRQVANFIQVFRDKIYNRINSCLKAILTKTTTEYSQSSSLHGIQYIFESGGGLLLSRVLWLILSVAAAILGVVWSVEVD